VRALTTASLLLAVCLSPAAAQDPDFEGHPMEASLEDTPKQAVFRVASTFKDFPDGTLLNVDLLVEGADSPRPVKAASFRVRVDGGKVAAEKAFRRQTWAPLTYRARLELQVAKQRKGVRDWFLREMGLGAAEQIILAEQVVEHGSKEEQATFRRETLLTMRGQLLELREQLGLVGKAIGKPRDAHGEEWQAKAQEARAPILELDKRVRAYLKARVSWHEQRLIAALRGTSNYLFQVLTMHFDKNNPVQSKRMLARAEHELKVGLEHIQGRLDEADGK
jgi:hypothetical protein